MVQYLDRFVYPPLPSDDGLRLLTLEPDEVSSPLTGRLSSVPFSSKPKYVSLSYTWDATSDEPSPIFDLNERSLKTFDNEPFIKIDGKILNIGRNLALALIYLRSENEPLTLWVDQICIDQANVAERNAQVALMAFIYTRASAVVAWVGMCGEGRHPDTLCLFDYDSTAAAVGVPSANFRADFRNKNVELTDSNLNSKDPYWGRLWIVQEVCLARAVLFVTSGYMWTEQRVTAWAHTDPDYGSTKSTPTPFQRLIKARGARFSPTMRLESLIEHFMHCGCQELRDRVYGLVGLANDVDPIAVADAADHEMLQGRKQLPGRGRGVILVDYRRSFYDIWCDVVSFMYFRARPQLDFGKEPHEKEDERRAKVVRFAGVVQNAFERSVEKEIGMPSPTTARVGSRDLGTVVVKGYIAGKILHLGPTYSDYVGSFQQQQQWLGSWEVHYSDDDALSKLREMEESYAVKIIDCSDIDIAQIGPIDSPGTVAWSLLRDVEPDDYLVECLDVKTQKSSPSNEPVRFLGDNHCMGLAPCTALVGDIVIRFWNCDAAIIMRPVLVEDTPKNMPQGEVISSITYPQQYVYRLVGRADIAEPHKGENDMDDRAKNAMKVFGADYVDGRYVIPYVDPMNESRYPLDSETKALYVRMSFATLQKISAAIRI